MASRAAMLALLLAAMICPTSATAPSSTLALATAAALLQVWVQADQAASWCQPSASRGCSAGTTSKLLATNRLVYIHAGYSCIPTFVDLDDDGDQDLVVGNAEGELLYFEHMPGGALIQQKWSRNPFDELNTGRGAAPTFVDLDGDGDQDLVVGHDMGDITYFEHTPAGTFLQREGEGPDGNPFHDLEPGLFATRTRPTFVDLDGDGDEDLVVGNADGELHYFERLPNATFLHREGPGSNPLFGVKVSHSAAPTFVDLDGDGDEDLVVGDADGDLLYFERMPDATFQRVGSNPLHGITIGRRPPVRAAPTFVDFDGDGDEDLVVGNFDGELLYFERTPDSSFARRAGPDSNPLYDVSAGRFSAPTFVDLDGDGDQDLLVGNQDGELLYFEHRNDTTFLQRAGNDSNPFCGIDTGKSAAPTFVDLDGDGAEDLVVGNEAGELRYFKRMPDKTFHRREGPDSNPLHGISGARYAVPDFVDLDGDGDQDLVVGNYEGKLLYFERMPNASFLQRVGPDSNPFHDITVGRFAFPTFVDLDGDGDQDLVIGNRSGDLSYFECMPGGTYLQRTGPDSNPLFGINVSYCATPTFADLDGDGDRDLVLGKEDGFLRYFQRGACALRLPCSGNGACRRLRCTCLLGYAADKDAECFFCEAGYEPTHIAGHQMRCRACSPGNSSSGRLTPCATCGEGTVAPSEGSRCSACAPGKIPSRSKTFCEDCPAGKMVTVNFTCDDCPRGKVVNDARTGCQECTGGFFPSPDGAECLNCSAGTFAARGAAECTPCRSGRFAAPQSKICERCELGEIPTSGQGACRDCPWGWTALPGEARCRLGPVIILPCAAVSLALLASLAFKWRQRHAERELKSIIKKDKKDMNDKKEKKGNDEKKHGKQTRAEILKMAIDKGHRCHVKKATILRAEAELDKEQQKYSGFEAFLDIVEDGDIKLLRGSWLADQTNIHRFVRQQDIMAETPEAFWEVNELRSLLQVVHFVIISYCWLHPVNPDPESKHLKLLQYALKKRLEVRGEAMVQDIAIVVDYLSLAQHGEKKGANGECFRNPEEDPDKRRTEAEQRQFNRGLGLLNIPYAHKQVQVWLMTWTPEGNNKYMDRGWPYFEQAVAGLVKDSTKLISLSPEVVQRCKTWDEIVEQSTGKHRRVPPLLPSEFEVEITKKTFTNGKKAQAFVADLYKRTFEEVIGHATVLWLVDLEWHDADAEQLAAVISAGACKKLKQLLVCGNPIKTPGATALVMAANKCETLELLDMTRNAMSTDERCELKELKSRIYATFELRVGVEVTSSAELSHGGEDVQEIEMTDLAGVRARTTTLRGTGARASRASRMAPVGDGESPLLGELPGVDP